MSLDSFDTHSRRISGKTSVFKDSKRDQNTDYIQNFVNCCGNCCQG